MGPARTAPPIPPPCYPHPCFPLSLCACTWPDPTLSTLRARLLSDGWAPACRSLHLDRDSDGLSSTPVPQLRTALNLPMCVAHVLTCALYLSLHEGPSKKPSRSWTPATPGLWCTPPLGTISSSSFFHLLSSQVEPWHGHPTPQPTVPINDLPQVRSRACLAKARLFSLEREDTHFRSCD